MPLEDSPSLEEYRQGIPQPPEDTGRIEKPPQRGRRLGWWLAIAALAVIALALTIWNFTQAEIATTEESFGDVVGSVVDTAGNPVQAEILVEASDIRVQADSNGRFHLVSVPAGRRALLIGYMYMAREYVVTVKANTTVDVGQIVIPSSVREGGYGRLEWR